jgi:hypothetical protein
MQTPQDQAPNALKPICLCTALSAIVSMTLERTSAPATNKGRLVTSPLLSHGQTPRGCRRDHSLDRPSVASNDQILQAAIRICALSSSDFGGPNMRHLFKRLRKGSLVHTTRGSRVVQAMCERRVEVSTPKTARILSWKGLGWATTRRSARLFENEKIRSIQDGSTRHRSSPRQPAEVPQRVHCARAVLPHTTRVSRELCGRRM